MATSSDGTEPARGDRPGPDREVTDDLTEEVRLFELTERHRESPDLDPDVEEALRHRLGTRTGDQERGS